MVKKVLKIVGIILAVLIAAVAGLVIWLTVTEYKPAAVEDIAVEEPEVSETWKQEMERKGTWKKALAPGDSLMVLSQNTGYAGLGKDADFFMDGGKDVAPDHDEMGITMTGLAAQLKEYGADVYLLQEVDTNSGRTHGIDQSRVYRESVVTAQTGGYSSAHALNYSCAFVPYPLPPIGKVHSGLQTLTRFDVDKAERIALPCPFSWPVRAANLKRCLLVSYVPLENSDKQLVLVNLHLEAYDDGEGKAAQTKMLMDLLTAEYEKGNYVIAGGDFNQTFPGALDAFPIQDPSLWTPGVLEEDTLPQGWRFACDLDTPSCRLLNHPYDPDPAGNQFYVIDGFILSPNVTLNSVETLDRQFEFTDHNPVALEVTLEPAEQSSPELIEEPAAGMELLRDVLLDRCSEELEELGDYTVSMYKDSEDFPQRIEDIYGVPSEQILDGFVIDDAGDDFFELVVLQMTDEGSTSEAMDTFSTYCRGLYWVDGVIPEENRAAFDYVTSHSTWGHIGFGQNDFFWFLICQDQFSVQNTLRSAINHKLLPALRSQEQQAPTPHPQQIADDVFFFDISSPELKGEPDPDHPGRAVYVRPNEEDMSLYDTSAITNAWASENPDQLSPYDRAIYDSAKEVLDSILQDGMDDFSKEAAIYEWVVQTLEYDWSQTDIMEETPRESYTPYGGLVNHKAVCLGYATTFQLLTELAGLESITVTGAGGEGDGSGDHAWNQVCLNGQWYCLDPAWESSNRADSAANSREWRFFNTTSDYMARTHHTWDYDSVPEATAEDHGCP